MWKNFLKKDKKRIRGFSLLETLIYIGIFAVVAGGLTGILWNTLKVTSNQQAANEVDENLRQAIAIVGEKVRSAVLIESASDSTLSLRLPEFSLATFSVTDGTLYFNQDGVSTAVTSNKVKVDSLNFEKIAMAGTKGSVRMSIALRYNSDKPDLAILKSLVSTINRAAAISFGEDLLPSVDNLYSIGADPNSRWLNGYFADNLNVGGDVDGGRLCVSGDCVDSWSDVGQWTSTTTGIYYNSGLVGIGTTTPISTLHVYNGALSSSNKVLYSHSQSGITSGYNRAIWGEAQTNASGVGSTFAGVYGRALADAVSNGGATGLVGLQGSVLNSGSRTITNGYSIAASSPINSGSGGITNAYSLYAGPPTNSSSGSITNAYAIYGTAPINSGSGSITNAYSLYVTSPTTATTLNYAIYADGSATSYFGGKVGIGTTTPINNLDVEGGVAIGAGYSGSNTAPANGLIVEGDVYIGVTSGTKKLNVGGDIGLTGTVKPDNICGITGSVLNFSNEGTIPASGSSIVGDYGSVMACGGRILAIGGHCVTADGSTYLAMEVSLNGVVQVCDTVDITSSTGVSTTGCNIEFLANNTVGCFIKNKHGNPDNCSCAVYVRFD